MLIALIYLQKERRYKLPVVYSLLVYALRAGFMCCMIGINYKAHNCVHKPVFFSMIFSKKLESFYGFYADSRFFLEDTEKTLG